MCWWYCDSEYLFIKFLKCYCGSCLPSSVEQTKSKMKSFCMKIKRNKARARERIALCMNKKKVIIEWEFFIEFLKTSRNKKKVKCNCDSWNERNKGKQLWVESDLRSKMSRGGKNRRKEKINCEKGSQSQTPQDFKRFWPSHYCSLARKFFWKQEIS